MTSPTNPYFARTLVNRMWRHFMGRGLVEPVDDFRATNPPTNAPLLDALAKDFVEHGYDLHHLIRRITSSAAYQLSSIPIEGNKRDKMAYSRYYTRRLTAEQMLDSIVSSTGRAGEVPVTISRHASVTIGRTRDRVLFSRRLRPSVAAAHL